MDEGFEKNEGAVREMGILFEVVVALVVMFAVLYIVLRYLPIFSLWDPIDGQDSDGPEENEEDTSGGQ